MIPCRDDRRAARRRQIQDQACRLVIEHGYDGFTMDELAAAVGVSRRTLFNHVPDKAAAVLGNSAAGHAHGPHVDAFRAGQPTGRLVADVLALVRAALVRTEVDDPAVAERIHLVERAVAADPKVATLAMGPFEGALDELVEVVCEREGWVPGDLRAQLLAARVIAILRVVFTEVRRRRGTGSFVELFDEALAAEAELLALADPAAGRVMPPRARTA